MLGAHYSSFVILRSVLLFSDTVISQNQKKKKKNGADHRFWVFGSNQEQINTKFLYCLEFLNKYSRYMFQVPRDGSIVRCQSVLIFGWKNLVTVYRRSFITSYCNYFFRSLFSHQTKFSRTKAMTCSFFNSVCPEVPCAFSSAVYWLLNSEWHSLWLGRQISDARLVNMANTEQGMRARLPWRERSGLVCLELEPIGRAQRMSNEDF